MTIILRRTGLFATSTWTADLGLSATDRSNLLRDAFRLLQRRRATDRPFLQTTDIDGFVDGPWWNRYFEAAAALVGEVAGHLPAAAVDDFAMHHTTWVLVISHSDEFKPAGGVVDLLHTHPRTTLASIYYLDLPDELLVDHRAGTLLRNPVGGHASDFEPVNVYESPGIDRMLVFPAHVEHAPARPDIAGPFSRPRVVIVSNWC